MSPLNVDEYHIDDLEPKSTEPMITELGATKVALDVDGIVSLYSNFLRDGTTMIVDNICTSVLVGFFSLQCDSGFQHPDA